MTAIPYDTKITGGGNNNIAGAFDFIFPNITTATEPTFALAAHPFLECWGENTLASLAPANSDSKIFWTTAPAYNIGATPFLGSSIRAIPTYAGAPGADWALNANASGGTAFPTGGKNRALRGDTDKLPLLPDSEDFLGDGNALVNRIPFNMAQAIHAGTSTTANALACYGAIRYSYLDSDPTCVLRGNTATSGEPSATDITDLDHTHMKSIAGSDPDLSFAYRTLKFGQAPSPDGAPYFFLPASGYVYSDKVAAVS